MTNHWCRYLFARDRYETARPSRDTVSPSCVWGWPEAVHPALVQQVARSLHSDVADYLRVPRHRVFVLLRARELTL